MTVKISPSILSANFTNLEQDIKMLEQAGADMIHCDVMDGSFVPEITFGSEVVRAIKKCTNLPLDVHLMVNSPERHIESFAKAGADIITIHAESTVHLERSLQQIKSYGAKCGVALVPTTSEDAIKYLLYTLDLVLVMTVNPGYGGQNFIDSQCKKIQEIRKMIDESGRNITLSVDGGINNETARKVISAGANMLVSGSYVFRENNLNVMKDKIELLRSNW